MFLLVPAYPGCPGSKAVKRSLLLCKCHVVAGAKICYDTMLSDLSMHAGSFVASSDLQTDKFDCVILTMPVPQLLQLHGDIVQILGALLYIISFLECSVNK